MSCFSSQKKFSIGSFSGRQSNVRHPRDSVAKPLFPPGFRSSGPEQRPKLPTDMKECADVLNEFLTTHKYSRPISIKILYTPNGPNTLQFMSIFEFIYQFIDAQFTVPQNGPMENTFLNALKILKCPYPFNKSQFKGIGTQHGWRPNLPILSWLCNYVTNIVMPDFPIRFKGEDFSDDIQMAIYSYRVNSYKSCKDTNEPNPELDKELVGHLQCEEPDEIKERCEEMRRHAAELRARLDENKRTRLTRDEAASDVYTIEDYILNSKAYMAAIQKQCDEIDFEVQNAIDRDNKLKEEMKSTAAVVASQQMSLQDVENLKLESSKVAAKVAAKRTRLDQQKQCTWNREMELASCNEEVFKDISKIYPLAKSMGSHLGLRVSELELEKLVSQETLPTESTAVNYKTKIENALKDLDDLKNEMSLKLLTCQEELKNQQERLKFKRKSVSMLEFQESMMDKENEMAKQQMDADWQDEQSKVEDTSEELKECHAAIGKRNSQIAELNAAISKLRKETSVDVCDKKKDEIRVWLDEAKQLIKDHVSEINAMFKELADKSDAVVQLKSHEAIPDPEVETVCEDAHYWIERSLRVQRELDELKDH